MQIWIAYEASNAKAFSCWRYWPTEAIRTRRGRTWACCWPTGDEDAPLEKMPVGRRGASQNGTAAILCSSSEEPFCHWPNALRKRRLGSGLIRDSRALLAPLRLLRPRWVSAADSIDRVVKS